MSINMVPIIEKKKYGNSLSKEDIHTWIQGILSGDIPDYQSSALLMAIRLNGMDFDETLALTMAMADSGDRLVFDGFDVLADKHSTGGIGDKVTIVLAPLVAACGLAVTMLSGRGLGFTGGTIDKFESLDGVSCLHDNDGMHGMVKNFGWANAQASKSIAPADRILYALRDVTGTVDSIPLITASILSKKIAGGATHLCLDVKCGNGAFMPDVASAKALAENLQRIGNMGGMSVEGLISRMEEPLGHAIGNYLELLESVHYLKEQKDTPLMELIFALGEKMLLQTKYYETATQARAAMEEVLANGKALTKLKEYLAYCGGKAEAIEALMGHEFDSFKRRAIYANRAGAIKGIKGRGLGELMIRLGAGRMTQNDRIDPLAGMLLNKHVGDVLAEGDVLAWVYGDRMDQIRDDDVNQHFELSDAEVEIPAIVMETF